jgi:hypothetical protein
MESVDISNNVLKSEEAPKVQIHSLSNYRQKRQSLFTRFQERQQINEDLKNYYFPLLQKQRLADFFAIPKSEASLDEILASQHSSEDKNELQRILQLFITNEIDSVAASKRLGEFLKQRPLAWEIWRLNDYFRFNKLEAFVETFKSTCLKDILQQKGGYRGPENVAKAMRQKIVNRSANQLYTASHRATKREEHEQKQYHSLFLSRDKLLEMPIFQKPIDNSSEKDSFFK